MNWIADLEDAEDRADAAEARVAELEAALESIRQIGTRSGWGTPDYRKLVAIAERALDGERKTSLKVGLTNG